MTNDTYCISRQHPSRPLLAWCQLLLKQCSLPASTAHDALSPAAISDRLQEISEPAIHDVIDLKHTLQMVASADMMFNLSHILERVIEAFELVAVDSGFPWRETASLAFPDGIEAYELPWRIREQGRLITGYYKPVPWSAMLDPIDDHYVHMSLENPMLIAYTRNDSKGEQDLQTTMKPGRYLAQFYPSLASHTVRDLQSGILRDAELKFAVTADDIEDIYVRGPSSCMSHEASHFDGPCHPVRVYGESDIQLAYVTGSHDRPTARSLVWPAKKYHSRVYGDECLLTHLLQAAGYERHSLKGARLHRIENDPDDDSVVIPYLDDTRSFDIVDEHWLRIGGPYDGSTTNGIAALEERAVCERCNDCDDELTRVEGEYWCGRCCDYNAVFSEYSNRYYRDAEQCYVVVTREDGRNLEASWTENERDEHATLCEGSQQYYQTDRFEFVELENGETWVAWYYEQHGDPDDRPSAITKTAADNDNVAVEERDAA